MSRKTKSGGPPSGQSQTQTDGATSSADTASSAADRAQTSQNSGGRSSESIGRWREPKNVREFASQANRVATMLLNGEISIDTARAYSAVARTAAQAVTAETARARFMGTAPDLTFEASTDSGNEE